MVFSSRLVIAYISDFNRKILNALTSQVRFFIFGLSLLLLKILLVFLNTPIASLFLLLISVLVSGWIPKNQQCFLSHLHFL